MKTVTLSSSNSNVLQQLLDEIVRGFPAVQVTSSSDLGQRVALQNDLAGAFVSANPIATVVIDQAHKVIHWNAACEEMTGISQKEALNAPIPSSAFYSGPSRPVLADMVLDGDLPSIRRFYGEDAFQTGTPSVDSVSATKTLRLRGRERTAYFLAALVRDRQGNPAGAIETLQDITEETQAAEELSRQNQQIDDYNRQLQEKNLALRELIATIQTEKDRFAKTVRSNLRHAVFPALRAHKIGLPTHQRLAVEHIEETIEQVTSLFVDRLSSSQARLTATEIRICRMIRQGMATKEIAATEHIAPATVSKHRKNIRRKLHVTNTGTNLRSHLESIATNTPAP